MSFNIPPFFPLPPADKMKALSVAKLAMQAADLYADAYSNMILGGVKDMWEKVK